MSLSDLNLSDFLIKKISDFLTEIPYNTKGEELRLELNKPGLNLKSYTSLCHALCEENSLDTELIATFDIFDSV